MSLLQTLCNPNKLSYYVLDGSSVSTKIIKSIEFTDTATIISFKGDDKKYNILFKELLNKSIFESEEDLLNSFIGKVGDDVEFSLDPNALIVYKGSITSKTIQHNKVYYCIAFNIYNTKDVGFITIPYENIVSF